METFRKVNDACLNRKCKKNKTKNNIKFNISNISDYLLHAQQLFYFRSILKWVGKALGRSQISRKIQISKCAGDVAKMAAHIDYRSAASRCVSKLFSSRQPVNSEVELFHSLSGPTGCANLQVGATSFRFACSKLGSRTLVIL